MTVAAAPYPRAEALPRLLRAGLLTAVIDGLFSSTLTVVFYQSTVTRLWQGVASTLRICVAFTWSTVFLFVTWRSGWIRRVLATPYGTVTIASLYGPLVWLVMSLVVIPLLVHRAPRISVRWWVQLFGHIPFVGMPIVASVGGRRPG